MRKKKRRNHEDCGVSMRLPGVEPGASGLGVDPIRHREVASNA